MIRTIRMAGFMCFREEQILELDRKVYALVARRKDDAERSNWLGKTTLLEAIRFGLYGWHRFRTDDEWISHGEPTGMVELRLGDGSTIKRTRARGKRTSVYFVPAKGDPTKPMMQDEAEAAIERLIGLSREDFEATCYFGQKAMSRFVTADPAERMRVVSAWMQLEPLERCVARVQKRAESHEQAAKKLEGYLAAIDARRAEIEGKGEDGNPVWTEEKLAAETKRLDDVIEALRGKLALLDDQQEKMAVAMAAAARRKDFERVVEEGKALKAQLDAAGLAEKKAAWDTARAALSEREGAVREANRVYAERRSVALGVFDGRCPVAGIDCPAKERINADRAPAQQRLGEAEREWNRASAEMQKAKDAEGTARASYQAAQRLADRLDQLRQDAKRLQAQSKAPAIDAQTDPEQVKKTIDETRAEMMEAASLKTRLSGYLEELHRGEKAREEAKAAREQLSGQLGLYREAAVIFGKRGAQRRVAEGSLAEIERRANEVLRDCGVALQVEVRWTREGKGLAKACDACGHPFPTSAKVKSCERCGASRGQALENKLDVVLSNRSGAAEDLAGIAVQLSASKWLRERRGATWSSAAIDEPFGALDAAHRKGLGRHLAAMLVGAYGFEQAFVVSHSADATNAIPGRIEIVSDGTWSKAQVIS